MLNFMLGLLQSYTKWLHAQWPAGTIEKLPVCDEKAVTTIPGVRIREGGALKA